MFVVRRYAYSKDFLSNFVAGTTNNHRGYGGCIPRNVGALAFLLCFSNTLWVYQAYEFTMLSVCILFCLFYSAKEGARRNVEEGRVLSIFRWRRFVIFSGVGCFNVFVTSRSLRMTRILNFYPSIQWVVTVSSAAVSHQSYAHVVFGTGLNFVHAEC